MGTKKCTRNLPAGLERTRRRFEQWRQTRETRTRIPEPLWSAAVKMAGRHGICRTAKVLRLHYYTLKERVETQAAAGDGLEMESQTAFFELAIPSEANSAQCTLEMENASGAKMRVHLKDVETRDLVVLSRSFWEVEP